MDDLLGSVLSRRPPYATIVPQISGYHCVSGKHAWPTVLDASRCCSGGWFLRIAVPGERVAFVTSRAVMTGGKMGREIQRLAWQKLEDLPEDDPARGAMKTVIT